MPSDLAQLQLAHCAVERTTLRSEPSLLQLLLGNHHSGDRLTDHHLLHQAG